MDKSSDGILGTALKIKKEAQDEDINEFAETAMNELLGWYGYGGTRDDVKMSLSCHSHPGSNSSDQESPKYTEGCEWCGKPVDESKSLSSSGATFCSELCFSQSRRANFKKNKTCDWCRHVRHTVSYVDFQDGASQLQFCSDKCLNQYKMHIFCRETRAHLELHPHLPDEPASTGGLITPDLWLKNCKSPDPNSSSPPLSPKLTESLQQTSPLPLITVAHPSKFMVHKRDSPELNKRHRTKVQKKRRRKCSATVTCSPTMKSPPITEIPQDLRIRHTPPTLDRLPYEDEPRPSVYNQNFVHPFQRSYFDIPNGFSAPHPRLLHPQLFSPPPQLPLPPQPPPQQNLLPPVTILVPYPLIIPLPLPIPIPIPLANFGKCKLGEISKKDIKNNNNNNTSQNGINSPESVCEDSDKMSINAKESSSNKAKQNDEILDDNEFIDVVSTPIRRKRKRVIAESKAKVTVKNKNSVPV